VGPRLFYPVGSMTLTRRRFLAGAAPLGAMPLLGACGGGDPAAATAAPSALAPHPFQHGVASGDPLADAVILWTRVTPDAPGSVEVRWRIAADAAFERIVAEGVASAIAEGDYTLKVDARGLSAATTYYYDFTALGVRSPLGRTRTLPLGGVAGARIGVCSCANYPAGFFSAYRRMAERADLDFVIHLGDYIYEYENDVVGDGSKSRRMPDPDHEAVTLDDYRRRHAQYKTDADLQELHRQHACIAIWDDHEVANNAYKDGAANHQPDSEGDWQERKASAMQAYFEWMPVRPAAPGDDARIYRSFAFGDLFDLVLLDTRFAGRDAHAAGNCDESGIESPARSLLGSEQEQWFFDALRASSARGARWRLVGQQVMLAQLSDAAKGCVSHLDQWDGYAASRERFLDFLAAEAQGNVVVLTGDAHSSWASDIAKDPFDPERYDAATGQGSLAVEFVAPAISSPPPGGSLDAIAPEHPHLKFADVAQNGYLLIDVSAERVQAEWYFVPAAEAGGADSFAAACQARSGENKVSVAEGPLPMRDAAPAPAP
jgi:alkaline phosphatase D